MIRSETRQSVLDEVLLEVRAVPDFTLLQIDREQLHLTQEKARERRARVRRARKIGEQAAEGERAGRRRRLDDVEALPAQIGAHLQRVPALEPGERVGNLRDARAEVGGRVRRRSELLIAADEKRRQGVWELGGEGMPGRFRPATRTCSTPRRSAPRSGGCRRCEARSACDPKGALVLDANAHAVVFCGTSVPVVTPLPSGTVSPDELFPEASQAAKTASWLAEKPRSIRALN